ncbi:MAG TPA: tetraacyldisaccharide 4'-kinase [Burkholderiales bacterium]|nr:tetraacyldisaccharide 4'-kinase [Burkholderiales bacterium]
MSFVDRHWYRLSWLSVLLLPAAALFAAVSALRRALYRAGLLPRVRLPVPVVVVGNIAAGGTGKTPLVLWLCDYLAAQGRNPGIVSRGYGGTGRVMQASASSAADTGDEPALLAQRGRCPVWVGRDRAAAARALLAAHPGCDVVVCDDGLQHYGLQRDVEIAVVDGLRGNGNGLPLPAGPLRESASRLREVDAVVVTGDGVALPARARAFAMSLEGAAFRNLLDPQRRRQAGEFRGERVHAVAGIGNPARFFGQLRALGVDAVEHSFPDHHAFAPGELDFPGADAIVMTEKDAIKCRHFARGNHWMLPVSARVDAALGRLVLEKLGAHGP